MVKTLPCAAAVWLPVLDGGRLIALRPRRFPGDTLPFGAA